MNAATRTNDSERKRAVLFLVLCAAMWSLGGLLIKMVTWNPVAIAGSRSAIAALAMLAIIRRPRFNWSFAQIGGAVAYAVTVILFVTANKLTTAANAILLQYTAPIYVALFGAWFLGERASWLDWATLAAVLGGMVLFFLDKLSVAGMLGNVIAIASGVALAGLALFLRKQKDGSPMESILLGNALTALIGLPFMLKSSPGSAGWLGIVLLGVFQLGLPYVLYALAIKHVTAIEAVLIPVIEPILNPLWVFLVVGEAPGTLALAGGAVVLVAVTFRCVAAVVRPELVGNGADKTL